MAPTSPRFDDDLRLAHLMADQADDLTLSRFRALDLRVSTKPDHTPVTDADTATERLIRQTLGRARTRDAIVGEEMGATGSGARRWVIDPIDGTKNYVRGVPVWATLIALLDGDSPAVGVVSAPSLGRRWWAVRGGGAYTGKSMASARRLHVSEVSQLADASLSLASLSGWREIGQRDDLIRLTDDVWRVRGYGDFWSYMLVAEGAVDIAAEPQLALHDMAALVPIVEEAGGRFTSLAGERGPFGGNALATNGLLHDDVLRYLGTTTRI